MAPKTHLWDLGGLLRREHLPSDANAVTARASAVPGARLVVAGLAYWVGVAGVQAYRGTGLFGSIVVCTMSMGLVKREYGMENLLISIDDALAWGLLAGGMVLVIELAGRPRAAGPLARSMLLRLSASSALGALLGLMSAQLSEVAGWTT
jgi:hypothetical protein